MTAPDAACSLAPEDCPARCGGCEVPPDPDSPSNTTEPNTGVPPVPDLPVNSTDVAPPGGEGDGSLDENDFDSFGGGVDDSLGGDGGSTGGVDDSLGGGEGSTGGVDDLLGGGGGSTGVDDSLGGDGGSTGGSSPDSLGGELDGSTVGSAS